MFTLDDEQEKHVAQMAAEPTQAALLAGDTGVGKTIMSLELAKRIEAKVILIIAPLNTNTKGGWEDTAREHEVGLPFTHITSSNTEAFQDLKARVPGIYFVGREFFALSGTTLDPAPIKVKGTPEWSMCVGARRIVWNDEKKVLQFLDDESVFPLFFQFEDALFIKDQRVKMFDKKPVKVDENGKIIFSKGRKALWSWGSVKPDLTIYDEVQAVSNRYSQGFTCLSQIKTGYRLAASATYTGNKFSGAWPVTRWLWPKDHNPNIPYDPEAPYKSLYVDNSQKRWVATWCETKTNIFKYDGFEVTGERVPGAFVNSLPCYIRMEATRTPYVVRKCYVDLSPKQRKMYDQMETEALAWLDDHPLVAEVPIVQRTRLRQMTLAEVSLDDEGSVNFADDCESSKIDALEKVLFKHHPGEPVFILTDSQKFARVVTARLGPLAREWSGKTSAKERVEIKAAFGDTVRYIVAVIPAVAEGLDGLQKVCNVEVWLSESLNGILNVQAEGRLNRRGQRADNIYQYKIMARDTDDDEGFERRVAERLANHASMRKGN